MVAAYARSQYEETQVQTTPGRLVVMLYDGALRFLHLGLDAMKRGDRGAQGLNLGKAQNILCELTNTLDFRAGDVAYELQAIYSYLLQRVLFGHAQDHAPSIEEAIQHMAILRDAWEYAERSVRAGDGALPEPELASALDGAAAGQR